MLLFFLVLFIVISIIGIALLILAYCEIEHLTKTLRQINDTDTNSKIRLASPNRYFENLAIEINRTLAKKLNTELRYKRMDARQRQDIANISHDLRTPLTSIIGYIQLLEDKNLTADEHRKYCGILKSRAKALQELIGGLFEMSRLEAGEYAFNIGPVNLQNILCDMMASFYEDFTKIGIEPHITIDQTVPLVPADENAARRIFSNLIQNVLRHGKNELSVELFKSNKYVVTTFINDAPDLTPDDASRLFERFYTADRVRTGQNTGLGLAITKALVENMGGVISSGYYNEKLSIIIKWKI